MKPSQKIRVKICCILNESEAQMAIKHGADAVGLVSAMPSGPGVIPDIEIAKIVRMVPPPVATFLLTCKTESKEIIAQHQNIHSTSIQLVDSVPAAVYGELRKHLPAVKIVQVIHVRNENSINEALAIQNFIDAILLDSGNPNLETKELGGTGRTHNWDISQKIRELVDIPAFLAGGLKPENIKEAIEKVRPFGVDICSGVRTNGKLDESKLKSFFSEIDNLATK
ncbi:phosphoribosylanthranilate isomerase [candidate division KSB1 bacterium]|nr:phosphoribosylanthranilate isomerase [candidate division KSB1 bacterium]